MRGIGLSVSLLVVLCSAHAAQAVTPQQIIAMTKAGQSAQTIISAIQKDKSHAPIDVPQILELKKAGVSDEVLAFLVKQAKLNENGNTTSPPAKTSDVDRAANKTKRPPQTGVCPHCSQTLLLPVVLDGTRKLQCANCGNHFKPKPSAWNSGELYKAKREPLSPAKRTIRYGWKIFAVDISVIAVTAAVLLWESKSGPVGMTPVVASGFVIGPPIVHAVQGNGLTWLGSGLMRLFMPGAVGGLAMLLVPCEGWDCLGNMAVGTVCGAVAAMAIDATVLAKKTELTVLPPAAFRVSPDPQVPELQAQSFDTWGLGISTRF